MKVEVTCLGCGEKAAVPVARMLPLCEVCGKIADQKARGVSLKRETPLSPVDPKEPS